MRGSILAPRQLISGAFNINISFQREVDLQRADVVIETIAGDPLGDAKDTFDGSGKQYRLCCYMRDPRQGKSRISVPRFDVPAVEITYDTVNEIAAVFLDPYLSDSGKRVEVPVLCLGVAIQRLRKRNIEVLPEKQIQVYGEDSEWTVSIKSQDTPVELKLVGRVQKENGLRASLGEDSIRIDASELRS